MNELELAPAKAQRRQGNSGSVFYFAALRENAAAETDGDAVWPRESGVGSRSRKPRQPAERRDELAGDAVARQLCGRIVGAELIAQPRSERRH